MRSARLRREPRGKITVRDGVLTGNLAKALSDVGIPAVEALDLLDQPSNTGATIEEIAQGRTLVAWDLEYIDPKRFRLRDHSGVLVIQISESVPMALLIQRIV